MKEKLTTHDKQIADLLRDEILQSSQSLVEMPQEKTNFSNFELISNNKKASTPKQETSPIFSMNEDEILSFVEEFNVSELATLSVAELNHIGEVLGVEPKILMGF